MKRAKIISCLVAASMVLGLTAGCGKTNKVTTEQFEKACEKLGCDEFDAEDNPDADDIEDGIYIIMDEDDIEDEEDQINESLGLIGLDDVVEADDIKSFGVFTKGNGFSDIENIGYNGLDDIEDLELDFAVALQATLKDDDKCEDIMDFVEDLLDDYDLDVDDLRADEYYRSKTEGYLRVNIDIETLAKIALDNDDLMDLLDSLGSDSDEIVDLLESISGNVCITLEVCGDSVIIVVGVGFNTESETVSDFCKAVGIEDPSKLKTNEEFIEDIVDSLVKNIMKFMSLAYSF